MIKVKNVSKVYGKKNNTFKALDKISFSLEDGASIAIIGKSGSGKSTLMHILALLDKPTSGAIEIDGKEAQNLSSKQLDTLRNEQFGFVFQQFFLNGNDSVLNNVILPLKIAGVSRRERNKRGREALKAVELDDKASSKAKDLSGGQKQRVCIARALINEPKVIFADEPTGNLDSVTGKLIEDMLFSLNQKQGITLVVVTHDVDLAKRCQQQIHIKDGRIIKSIGKAKLSGKGSRS